MKKLICVLSVIALVVACKPESKKTRFVALKEIALSEHSIVVEKGANAILYVTFSPKNATKKALTWVSSDLSVATVADGIVVGVAPGSTEILVRSGDCVDRCQVSVLPSGATAERKPAPTGTVDLGTDILRPDGSVYTVYWATCNLGASAPEENGDYFTWGDPDPHYLAGHGLDSPCYDWRDGKTAGYAWNNYKWNIGTESTSIYSKYNLDSNYGAVDGLTELQRGEKAGETVDDMARARLGGKWRLPTHLELTELRVSCDWVWTEKNGMKGYQVTSRSTGNQIFLPAAGYRYGIGLAAVGKMGIYWSSNLCESRNAWVVFFQSEGYFRDMNDRFYGLSVRPVTE